MYGDNALGLLAFFGAFAFVFFIIGLIFYIAFAMGLMTLAKRRGIENAFLAFIPVANLYIMGLLIKELKIFSFDVPSPELVLPGASLAAMFLGGIPLIGWLLSLAYLVLIFGAIYTLFNIYVPQSATLYTILSPFVGPFLVFMIRNNDPVNLKY